MASSRLRRLLVRLNLLPATKRKGRKKSKVDTFLDRGYNEKDIEKFMDLFGRRCISQDFISEMKEAFSLFDKVRNEKKLDRLKISSTPHKFYPSSSFYLFLYTA